MDADPAHVPQQFKGVMVSSRFKDLEPLRKALIDALLKQELHPVGMEHSMPKPGDTTISSSLNMVRKSSAYIGLISQRYGQVKDEKLPWEDKVAALIARLKAETEAKASEASEGDAEEG